MGDMTDRKSLYEPALDGLRLVAFLAVFLHHLPAVGIGRVSVACKAMDGPGSNSSS